MNSLPLMVRISFLSLLLYLIVGALLGNISAENEFYHSWVIYGIYPIAIISLVAGFSWIRYIRNPLKFFIYSFLTSLVVLGFTFIVTYFYPDAIIIERSNIGEINSTERAPLAIMVWIVSVYSIAISFVITMIGAIYLKWKAKKN